MRSFVDFFGLIIGADVVLRASEGAPLEFSPVEPQALLDFRVESSESQKIKEVDYKVRQFPDEWA